MHTTNYIGTSTKRTRSKKTPRFRMGNIHGISIKKYSTFLLLLGLIVFVSDRHHLLGNGHHQSKHREKVQHQTSHWLISVSQFNICKCWSMQWCKTFFLKLLRKINNWIFIGKTIIAVLLILCASITAYQELQWDIGWYPTVRSYD